MRIGEMNKRLRFKKLVEKKDDAGAPYEEYERDFECWGGIEPNRGQEIFQGGRFDSQVDGIIQIRYRECVTSDHIIEVVGENRELEIEAAYDPDGVKERLEMAYREVG